MEDVLDLYAEAPDPDRPVVCFDESPVQLIGEVRQPIPAEPGQLERYDYEYRRNGTVNLFVCIDVHRPWRKVKSLPPRRRGSPSGGRRKTPPTACANSSMSIIPTLRASASCRITCRPTRPAPSMRTSRPPSPADSAPPAVPLYPKHASWLNMVEIEIGVLRGQCLDRRIDDPDWLRREIDAWERQRNAAGARINWMFTTDKARAKMGRAYPVTSKES
jgi:hypothetical protein